MKILDKYLLRSLAGPLCSCLAAFTMVYVIFDLFGNLDDFLQGGASLYQILRFYLLIVPTSLIFICPVSMLLSVLYCLSTLSKNSEWTAMRACGLSVARLSLPFLLVGTFLSGVTAVVNETLAPEAAYRTKQFVRIQRADDKKAARMATYVALRNVVGRRTWMITLFDTQSFDMYNVELIQLNAQGLDLRKITAERATWTDGRWWLENVAVQTYDDYGSLRGLPQKKQHMELDFATETPDDFLNVVKDSKYLSAREILRFRAAHASMSDDAANRLAVDFHSRLASPWSTLVVTLLGISFGNQTARKGALTGVMLAISLFFGFYVLTHFGMWAGKEGWFPAWLAGWGPNGVFLAVGLSLLSKMK
jgi:lipopolysaccharide export system permease protein